MDFEGFLGCLLVRQTRDSFELCGFGILWDSWGFNALKWGLPCAVGILGDSWGVFRILTGLRCGFRFQWDRLVFRVLTTFLGIFRDSLDFHLDSQRFSRILLGF